MVVIGVMMYLTLRELESKQTPNELRSQQWAEFNRAKIKRAS